MGEILEGEAAEQAEKAINDIMYDFIHENLIEAIRPYIIK